ncbi:MAG: AbrB/MazE/SpoVT family DNA-binding domain-containing protein [Oscillospiraceae bacterium]|nr:AbrB/MazE/SpoVT family DNA-binding domain-containing protein [Oscillospiraceae bacterium]
MKATGIVRRIDDLGRVVIPKEIRRTLRIREGDPLEIYTEKDGEVIFKKYSPMGDLTEFAGRICESLHKNTGFPAAICDRDTVIAAAGPGRQDLIDRRISHSLIRRLEDRERCCNRGASSPVPVVEGNSPSLGASVPVLSQGDLLGGILLAADTERNRWPGEFECKLLDVVAGFLGRQMET